MYLVNAVIASLFHVVLKLHNRYVLSQGIKIEELTPRHPLLFEAGLPVVEVPERGQNHHPVRIDLAQLFHQLSSTAVNIASKIEALADVYIIDEVATGFLPFGNACRCCIDVQTLVARPRCESLRVLAVHREAAFED